MTGVAAPPLDARPQLRLGRSSYPVVLPRLTDTRLHVASVIVSLHVLGQLVLGFRVSVPQILAAILSCALAEMIIAFRRERSIVWPASAMLTGSGVGLILRDASTEAGEHWTFRHWWLFAGIALFSLATKYAIRWRGSHVFNPSNLGLVVAFIVLGSDRIEPLDFWWGPFSVWMLLAYWLIVSGGVLVTERLGLLELAGAFWTTFALCMAALSASGHCITAPWSASAVCGGRFWWTIVTSPELLVFVFFMITDPRTVPSSRVGRVAFGIGVAVVSSLLIAPQTTEFGAKVGLLGGLVVMCAIPPVMQVLGVPSAWERSRLRTAGDRHLIVRSFAGVVVLGLVLPAVAAAGAPARSAVSAAVIEPRPDPREYVFDVDEARLGVITVDPEVEVLDPDLVGPGSRLAAIELLRGLDVEVLAFERGDATVLSAVDHGGRLVEMRDRLARYQPGDTIPSDHRFDTMELSVVRSRGQGGLRLAITGRGSIEERVLDESGGILARHRAGFSAQFVLRAGDDGRWFIVEERAQEDG